MLECLSTVQGRKFKPQSKREQGEGEKKGQKGRTKEKRVEERKQESRFLVIYMRITMCTEFTCFASALLLDPQADCSN